MTEPTPGLSPEKQPGQGDVGCPGPLGPRGADGVRVTDEQWAIIQAAVMAAMPPSALPRRSRRANYLILAVCGFMSLVPLTLIVAGVFR